MYLRRAKQTPNYSISLRCLSRFPASECNRRSVVMCLNTAIAQMEYEGIPLLRPCEPTRYLGVQIGRHDITAVNWDRRITSIKARLATVVRVTTSVISRIRILNVVVLPAILFTAQFSRASDQVIQTVENLQKQFLWERKLSTAGRKHKMNPGLLSSPVVQGGLGFLSVPVAIKAQLMRRATAWLLAEDSVYKQCWTSLLARVGAERNTTTPMVGRRRRQA